MSDHGEAAHDRRPGAGVPQDTGPGVTAPTRSTAGRVLALGLVELRLLARNRTVLFTAVITPLLFGLYVPWTFADAAEPVSLAVALTTQLAFVLAFDVFYAVVATVVARRNSRVLKRFRTSGIGDAALLAGMLAPPVVIAVALVLLLVAANPLLGLPLPAQPLALVVALVAGLALAVTLGLATTLFTRNAEQAAFTTMPGILVLLVALVGAVFVGLVGGAWSLLALLPGVGVGHFASLAATGAGWTADVPTLLLALAGCVAWPVALGLLARRRFRWEPRTAG